jgi:methyl-accepting chemotaxis protein
MGIDMGLLRNLSVKTRLLGSFIIVCTITAVVGTVGVMKLAQVNAKIDTMYNKELIGTAAVKDAALAVAAVGRDARQAILSNDAAEQQRIADGVSNYEKTIETAMTTAESCFYTAEGKALIAKNLELLPPFIAKVRETNLLATAGKKDEALKAVVESRAIAKVIIENLDDLAERKRNQAAEANEASKQLYSNARIVMFSFIGGGVLLGLGLGYVIARAITVPLTQAVGVLQAIAAGDLTVRLNSNSRDEVGKMADSLNSAVGSMQEALSEVRGVADNVASASQQLASASQQISTGAQEQASSLEETASSLEEITATIRQNADNADQANQLSARSREVAEKGGKVVGDAVTGMQEINAASKRIADIITAIDEIAFQTNLLALNAAVEAARRRTGRRLCGRGRRSPQPRPAQCGRGEGDQGFDSGLGPQGRSRHPPGQPVGRNARRDHQLGEARDRYRRRDFRRFARAGYRHRAGEPRRRPDGSGDARERFAD